MKSAEEHHILLTDLTMKFLSGDISSSEKDELDNLISANDENRSLFLALKKTWFATSTWQNYIPALDTSKSWEKVQASINAETSPQAAPNRITWNTIWKIVAAGLILISISSLLTLQFTKKSAYTSQASLCEVSTPLGSRSHTILPDGTEVWLNAGTTLKYPVAFTSRERDVYLTGEAYFKVKSDKAHPFVVHYADIKIKAVGTEFNVKAYPDENRIETTLINGIVNMEGRDKDKKIFRITMMPKQKITLIPSESYSDITEVTHQTSESKEEIQPKQKNSSLPESLSISTLLTDSVKTVLYTSWKDDQWVFEGEKISKIAILLERRYNVSVLFNPGELKNYTFTGTFQQETLEQVLEVLKITSPVRYQMMGKGVVKLSLDPVLIQKYNKYIDTKK